MRLGVSRIGGYNRPRFTSCLRTHRRSISRQRWSLCYESVPRHRPGNGWSSTCDVKEAEPRVPRQRETKVGAHANHIVRAVMRTDGEAPAAVLEREGERLGDLIRGG